MRGVQRGAKLSVANLNPLRYRGYYCDSETGFYYLQSRYYDPIVRRFLNGDSFASTGQGILGYNMFAYCNNNPVISTDSTGHSCVALDPVFGGGGGKKKEPIPSTPEKTYPGQANCYAYAFQMGNDPRTGAAFTAKPQPGEFGGAYYWDTMIETAYQHGGEITSEQIKDAIVKGVKADGKVLGFNIEEVNTPIYHTETGQWVVALAYDHSSPDCNEWDYHWWRRMSDGTWQHKPGSTPIMTVDASGQTIWDPKTCDRGRYGTFFGYYLVTPNK